MNTKLLTHHGQLTASFPRISQSIHWYDVTVLFSLPVFPWALFSNGYQVTDVNNGDNYFKTFSHKKSFKTSYYYCTKSFQSNRCLSTYAFLLTIQIACRKSLGSALSASGLMSQHTKVPFWARRKVSSDYVRETFALHRTSKHLRLSLQLKTMVLILTSVVMLSNKAVGDQPALHPSNQRSVTRSRSGLRGRRSVGAFALLQWCNGAREKERGKGGWLDWWGLDLVSVSSCYTQCSSI